MSATTSASALSPADGWPGRDAPGDGAGPPTPWHRAPRHSQPTAEAAEAAKAAFYRAEARRAAATRPPDAGRP